jgi:hypothetical protein
LSGEAQYLLLSGGSQYLLMSGEAQCFLSGGSQYVFSVIVTSSRNLGLMDSLAQQDLATKCKEVTLSFDLNR